MVIIIKIINDELNKKGNSEFLGIFDGIVSHIEQ